MNLRDLKYAVAVSDLKHFGKAAEACHVSQPTLSMQLKKLEDTLGVVLFERSNRQVLPTPVGQAIIGRAREVLHAADQLVETAKLAQNPMAGELTLGAFPTLAPYLLPLVMPKLNKVFSKLTIRLVEEKTDVLIAALAEGRLDCALIALPVHHPLLTCHELFNEEFLLATPASHALAKRKRITVPELHGQTLLLLDEGHCLREQALEVCQRIGAQESQSFRATSLETLRQMVAGGQALTLIPKLAARKEQGVAYVPFSKPPVRRIGLFYRKTSVRKEAMAQLASQIAQAAKAHLA